MDLSTDYLSFSLPHPFIAGASPLADTLDSVRQLEDAGAAAIVLRSLFEEQLSAESMATHRATETPADSFGEALSYLPSPADFRLGSDDYLEHIRRIKAAVDIPVLASLNGMTPGGWLDHARLIEQAGADALELNLYHVSTDPQDSGATIEQRDLQVVREVRGALRIPIAVKLSPFYTSLAHFAQGLVAAGADGLVLLNRFFEPDIDIDELEVVSHLRLSSSEELRLRLRWLGIVSAQVRVSLAVSGGVHTAVDAVKAVMCGAHAVQLVSVLLSKGPRQIEVLHRDMIQWLEEKEYDSLRQMHGSMNQQHCPQPRTFERANYIRMLQTWQP